MPIKKNTNKLSQLYRTIDQKELSKEALDALAKLRLATANFRKQEGKEVDAFKLFFDRLIKNKPTAVKTTPEYKAMIKERRSENGRKAMEARKAKQESRQGQGSEEDSKRPAKPFGWRLRGKHNYRKPTRADISSGRAYYEARINRADTNRTKFPMLERGGFMANGGEVGEYFTIAGMNEKLNRMFPDSFGFSVGNFSDEGNKSRNSSALIANPNDPFRGLKDSDIGSKLFFPQYKQMHDIRFRIYQGGENTYFYFNLESEKGDEYIGQFGFKDGGYVPSSYITRFIAFLMEQYGLPFEVNHSVMADGGYMAKGGRVLINWNGKKSKETLGKENLYTKYDSTLDLFADVSDYFKELAKDINQQYALEQKNDLISILKNDKLTFNDGATLTFADGGFMADGGEMDKMELRETQIKFKIASVIGIDEAIKYLDMDFAVSPFELIRGAVVKGFITIDEINKDLFDAALSESYGIDERYKDSGEGIGGSDMNAFIANMLNDAGIRVKVVNNRWQRMADGGMMAKGGAIKNQYEGREFEDIWNNLTFGQRLHFLKDHESDLKLRLNGMPLKDYFEETRVVARLKFAELKKNIQDEFIVHVYSGQYADGGFMAKGGRMKGDTLENVRNDAKTMSRNQDIYVIEEKRYEFLNRANTKEKSLVTQYTNATQEDVDYMKKVPKNSLLVSLKIKSKYSNGELKSAEEQILFSNDDLMAKGGAIEMGDNVNIIAENKSGVVVNVISDGKHFTLKFADGTKNVYDKHEIKKILDEDDYAKGGQIKYSTYDNKSMDYIEGEIAHTERSARQFQQMGDYESMEDRKEHVKMLREIYNKKRAESKMAKGGVFYTDSHKQGH